MSLMRGFLPVKTGVCLLMLMTGALLIWPADAHVGPSIAKAPVCACCADEGEWYERTERVSSALLVQLDRMRFSQTANTFMGPGEEHDLAANYSLSQTRTGRNWQLRLRDEQGKTGVISFAIPASAVAFGTDLHDAPPGGVGPALYKEWRFNGAARVTGVFSKGLRGPARFRLILQGRGNHCDEAEHYKNWRLQVSGGPASFILYGSLNDPN